jgi:anti-sigma regulatory factor (Ser/Thr protein kinase)
MAEPVLEERFTVPPGPESISAARHWVGEALAPLHLPRGMLEELKVALSEATTNAMFHGRRGDTPSSIEIYCRVEPAQLVLEVDAEGEPFVPREITLPDVLDGQPRGRGLFLMQQFVDRLEFLPCERGVRVRLIKELRT